MGLNTLYEFPFGPQINPWIAVGRINAQAVLLVTQRAQAYLDFSAGLGEGKTTDDLLTQQMSFWQIAQRQYLETAQRSVLATLPVAGLEPSTDSGANKGRPRDYMVVREAAPATVSTVKSGVDFVGQKPSGAEKPVATERMRRTA